jgi:hypothetical protein
MFGQARQWGPRSRGLALTISCILFFYIIAALALAVYTISTPGWDPKEYNGSVEEQANNAYRRGRQHPTGALVRVTISVRSINPQSYMASGVVGVCFLGGRLTDSHGRDLAVVLTRRAGLVANGSLQEDSLALALTVMTPQGTESLSVPVKSFRTESGCASTGIDLPLTGFPQNFPNDYYDLRAECLLGLPSGARITLSNGSQATSITTQTLFEIGSGLSYWRAKGGPPASVSTNPAMLGLPSTRLYRPGKFSLYIYAICTVPTAFLLIYFVLTAGGPGRSSTSHFELGVAILVIVSLRQVFVPDGVICRTRLDHILGLSLVLCVAMTALVSILHWRSCSRDNGDAPPSASRSLMRSEENPVPPLRKVLTRHGWAVLLTSPIADKHVDRSQ